MAQWYVLRETEVVGPLQPKELLELVRRGSVRTDTKLRKDDSPWFPAGEVGGLFEAAVKPTVILRCPGCQTVVPEPPCQCPQCGRQLELVRREVIQHRIASPTEIARQQGVGSSMQNWLNKIRKKN